MAEFLVGIVALAVGAAVCFAGLRLWFALLPIWGFVAGFFLGATATTAIFGDGFLSTVTGWMVGIGVGIVFALLSYLIWYFGVILAAGSVGALIGSAFAQIFTERGWIVFIFSLAGSLVLVLAALVVALPIYIVIANTAAAGAAGVIAGVLLVFNQLELEGLGYGAAWAAIEESWFWLIVWAALFVAGILYQLRTVAGVALPEEKWTRVDQTMVTATSTS